MARLSGSGPVYIYIPIRNEVEGVPMIKGITYTWLDNHDTIHSSAAVDP